MIDYISIGDKRYYDIQTLKEVLGLSKAKIQRGFKKQNPQVIKYKNLFLYPEKEVLILMETILLEKIKRKHD